MAIVFSVPQKIGPPKDNGVNVYQILESIHSSSKLNVLNQVERRVLSSVFGKSIKSSIYGEPTPDANPDSPTGLRPTAQWGGYMSSSLTKMPVLCRLKFVGTTYIDLDGSSVTIPDIIFETVLISLRQNKNIKKTSIFGRRKAGTVKEACGNGDWDIDIRAIVTQSANVTTGEFGGNQEGMYPLENMDAIRVLLESNITIRVECWYLNRIAGINYVMIESGADISQVEGEYEMQRISIPCISDNPLIITIAG